MNRLTDLILPGTLGLLLGLTLRWTRLCRPEGLRNALALRIRHETRSLLYAVGAFIVLSASLMWLAVIDVDSVVVLPLSAGALAGGAVFGAAAALSGYTPLTAFCGRPPEALSTLGGCLAGAMLLPLLSGPLDHLRRLPPFSGATLFATTLDEPHLLGGGFLSLACTGLLLMTIAAVMPSNRVSRSLLEETTAPHSAPVPSVPPLPPLPPIPVQPPRYPRLSAPHPLLRLSAPQPSVPEDTAPPSAAADSREPDGKL